MSGKNRFFIPYFDQIRVIKQRNFDQSLARFYDWMFCGLIDQHEAAIPININHHYLFQLFQAKES
jgi:hypothetical protein